MSFTYLLQTGNEPLYRGKSLKRHQAARMKVRASSASSSGGGSQSCWPNIIHAERRPCGQFRRALSSVDDAAAAVIQGQFLPYSGQLSKSRPRYNVRLRGARFDRASETEEALCIVMMKRNVKYLANRIFLNEIAAKPEKRMREAKWPGKAESSCQSRAPMTRH